MPPGNPQGYSKAQLQALAWEWEQKNRKPQGFVGPPEPEPSDRFVKAGVDPSGALGYLGEMASNIPSSAGQFARDMTAIVHSPIETVSGLGKLAAGLIQKAVPGEQGSEATADAVGRFLMDRYGSMDAIKNTLYTDPVGMLADVAGLVTGGAGLAVKTAGTAGKVGAIASKAGKLAKAADPTALVGKGVTAAAQAGKNVAGTTAANVLGLTTGAKTDAVRTAYQAGQEGGAASQALTGQMRGKAPMSAVAEQARGAIANLRQKRNAEFEAGKSALFQNRTDVLEYRPIHKALVKVARQGTFKGKSIAPSTSGTAQQILDASRDWGRSDPTKFHTVQGFDALRQKLRNIKDSTEPHTPERRLADQAYSVVRKVVTDQVPEYGEVLKRYAKATDELTGIEKELSLGDKATNATALRKLQSIVRQDASAGFGERAALGQRLRQSGAGTLQEGIAGQALQSFAPRGLAGMASLTGAGYGAATNPAVLAAAPMFSPRLVGEAAHLAGQGSTQLAEILARLPSLPPGTAQALYQSGRLQGR